MKNVDVAALSFAHRQRISLAAIVLLCPFMAAAQESRQVYNHGNPTAHEQLMLELINRTRANPAAEATRLGLGLNDGLTAGTISTAPKPPLAFQPALIKSARAHSKWMLDFDTFSHTGVGGSSATTRMVDAGFVFSGTWTSGENIAYGGTTGTIEPTQETIARHDGLFRSPGHRTNLCNPAFAHVGVGVISGTFNQYNALMATQNFARSGQYSSSLLLGVIYVDANGDETYDPGEGVSGVRAGGANRDGTCGRGDKKRLRLSVVPEGVAWEAITSSSGGYAVPYIGTSGALNVTISGGPLTTPISRSFTKTGDNLKMDLIIPPTPPKSPEIVVERPSRTGTKTFTIRNSGTATLTGLAVSRSGTNPKNFIVTQPPKTSLKPGDYTTFKASFKPTAKGTRTATMKISSNDEDESPFDIKLTGIGVD